MCLNDPKKDDFPTFSKDVSEHLGTAPTSRGWCRPSFRVVWTFLEIALFEVIWGCFLKMCLNDPKKDDCAKISKLAYDESGIAPALPTCCRRSLIVIGVLWSTFVFESEMHILVFLKNMCPRKKEAVIGTKFKKWGANWNKIWFPRKKSFFSVFEKCAQMTSKTKVDQSPKKVSVKQFLKKK